VASSGNDRFEKRASQIGAKFAPSAELHVELGEGQVWGSCGRRRDPASRTSVGADATAPGIANRRVAEGFDVAIRVRSPPLEPTELVMRQLDESIQCLVASPALIRTPLSSPGDLSVLPSLGFGPAHRDHQWQLDHRDGQTALIPYRPRLITDDIAVLREATLAGVGVAQLPTIMAWEDIRAGRLVNVLPQWQPRSAIVHAVFPSRRGLLPSVRALLDFLVRECAVRRQLVSSAAS
jgi:DNA-binding transcriptional LysR family regulator